MYSYTHKHILHFSALVLVAFVLRAAVFHWYIQYEERYNQPDSPGYHLAGLCIAYGHGMTRPDTKMPIFWRTPGYPWYLSHFFKKHPPVNSTFEACKDAHLASIWLQILLTSLIPLFVFFLALTLTQSTIISWIVAWISAFHMGFVLASTFLLTDALAQLFFVLFLLCFFRGLKLWREKVTGCKPFLWVTGAALSLSIYTWMRPMGQFVALAALILMLFAQGNWKSKLTKIVLFIALFGATIAPWFIRNHRLTGHWTFCPLFGLYFNVFNAPKILARINNCKLEDAHKQLTMDAGKLTYQKMIELQKTKSPYVVCGEMVCLQTALPLLLAHPFYFMYDWCVEVAKTTFDLYASQLVALYNNCFKWDPIVEFLDEKIKECLYKKPLPMSLRILAWFEFMASILIWLGIIAGFYIFTIKTLFNWKSINQHIKNYGLLWLTCLYMIGAVVGQTGGFGYARLRIPVEPLILILAVTFWYYVYKQYQKKATS